MRRVISLQDIEMTNDGYNACYFKCKSGCFDIVGEETLVGIDYYKLSQNNSVIILVAKSIVDNLKYFVDESEYNEYKRVGDIISINVNDCLREYSIEDIDSPPDGTTYVTLRLKACD